MDREVLLEKLREKAEKIYAQKKMGSNAFYAAPEMAPKMKSDQVNAVIEAVADILSQTNLEWRN